jgi:hypothetical protein
MSGWAPWLPPLYFFLPEPPPGMVALHGPGFQLTAALTFNVSPECHVHYPRYPIFRVHALGCHFGVFICTWWILALAGGSAMHSRVLWQ